MLTNDILDDWLELANRPDGCRYFQPHNVIELCAQAREANALREDADTLRMIERVAPETVKTWREMVQLDKASAAHE